MKKALSFAVALASFALAFSANATVFGIAPGDLIKLKDDGNPKTLEDRVVYYFDVDWKRHPFPNQKIFNSWYKDFSGVKELTKEEMAELRLAANVTYRPGTRLVKVPSIPKVYAVEPGGMLRWIESEAVAKALYGNDWAKRVDDVQESFFVNYKEGAPLTVPVWPTGTVVRRASDDTLFVIDGYAKRHLTPAIAANLGFIDAHVIRTTDGLSGYADLAPARADDWKYKDASQLSIVDTPAPAQFDFPASVREAVRGQDAALAVFRVATGMPIILRKFTATISGPLGGTAPALSDLRLVDTSGENLFGVKQLESPGATSETVVFTGAYTMKPNAISVIEFRAKVAADVPKGATFIVAIDRAGLQVADGANGTLTQDFYPRAAFPTFTVTVK